MGLTWCNLASVWTVATASKTVHVLLTGGFVGLGRNPTVINLGTFACTSPELVSTFIS